MARKKILVVDDTEFNRELVSQLLEDEYDIVIAEDGAEALEKIEQEKPDLILMDLGLPVMDGWEATRRIKANEAHKHIPVIAVTSHAMVGEESKARDAGDMFVGVVSELGKGTEFTLSIPVNCPAEQHTEA